MLGCGDGSAVQGVSRELSFASDLIEEKDSGSSGYGGGILAELLMAELISPAANCLSQLP